MYIKVHFLLYILDISSYFLLAYICQRIYCNFQTFHFISLFSSGSATNWLPYNFLFHFSFLQIMVFLGYFSCLFLVRIIFCLLLPHLVFWYTLIYFQPFLMLIDSFFNFGSNQCNDQWQTLIFLLYFWFWPRIVVLFLPVHIPYE